MGGSVSVVSPGTVAHNEFKALYNDKKAMRALFNEIASYDHDEVEGQKHWKEVTVSHLDIKDKICLSEILLFISREANPIFAKNVTKNVIALKEAFKFAIGPKASKNYTNHEMGKKEFRKLVPALLLFTELYNVFHAADSNIDDDRIFPAEYARARSIIANIDGVAVNPISQDEWENEFKNIDANHNGYITFSEFSKYALAKIITPTFYINEITLKADQEQEVIDAVGSQVVEATMLQTMNSVSQKSTQSMMSTPKAGASSSAPTIHENETTDSVQPETSTTPPTMANDNSNVISTLVKQTSTRCILNAISSSVNGQAAAEGENRRKAESTLTKQMSSECVSMAISQSMSALGGGG